ncbi:MAG TPA: TetR/AcrR family transcriptional regulator [Actinotalea sp.]|nr:TetR/AcrR family transcriptional regulator [Actinotalea sp.]
MNTSSGRSYRQTARADAAAATGERILDATVELFWEQPDGIVLNDVARAAGVTVQTVLRRFGTKADLLHAAASRERDKVASQRGTAPVGDTAAAVAVLVEHYEQLGDRVMRLLSEESRTPALREITDAGRALHREWCLRVFAPALTGRTGADHDRRLAQLVAVCDVYTWKLLRRDAGLDPEQTRVALVELLDPLME